MQKSVNSRFCHGELVEPYNEINKLQIPFDRLRVTIGDFCKSLRWVQEAQRILAQIGGGATALPPADGTWLNPENGEIIQEKTKIIYSYIYPDKFEENIGSLREFLHRFGRETNQGEVVIEFDGTFYRIQKYDVR